MRSRKNRSTMFSHELLVGVKCIRMRGCRFNQRLDFGAFVRSVVIGDEVKLLGVRIEFVNHPQESQPFLMPMPVVAHADDGAV